VSAAPAPVIRSKRRACPLRAAWRALVTPKSRRRPSGGGTALLRGSHRQVARYLFDRGAGGATGDAESDRLHMHLRYLVRSALRRDGRDGVSQTVGDAGDVLIMHPLLVHAVSDALSVSFERDARGCWHAVRHGIRVSFNLSVHWVDRPMRVPAPTSPLEQARDCCAI